MLSIVPFKLHKWTYLAFIIIAVSIGFRFLLIASNWPTTNSDEGTVGMMALNTAYRGEHPFIFYGQAYMGTIESYIAAVLFHLVGPSLFTLRLSLILLFIPFMFVMYLLTSLLYSRKLALFTLLLLGLAPKDVILQQLTATAGHPEMPLFGAFIMLLASMLALTSYKSPFIARTSNRRLLAYTIWGLASGIAFWDDFLIIPFIVTSALLLFLACKNEIRLSTVLCCAIGGFLIGALPIIAHTLKTPLSDNPATVFGLQGSWKGHNNSLWQSIAGTLIVTLPLITGANSLCALPADNGSPLARLADPVLFRCSMLHIGWSLAFLLLLTIAVVQAFSSYWRFSRRALVLVNDEKKTLATLHLARLLLLGTASIILLEFVTTPQPAVSPWTTSRYLIGLIVAFPAVLWPLWNGFETFSNRTWNTVKGKKILIVQCMLISLLMTTSFLGIGDTLRSIPAAQADYQQQNVLIQDLKHLGITHFYTEYWTCDRITFESLEKLTCAVVGTNLEHGMNRYLPYSMKVWNDPKSPYVVPIGTDFEKWVRDKAAHTKKHGRLLTVDHYIVYLPSS